MDNSKKAHINIEVWGKVQGVGFRYATVRVAHSLSVTGFVRNTDNGSVYIEAEGTKDILDEFTRWCAFGPAYACVENIITTGGPLKDFTQFEVLH